MVKLTKDEWEVVGTAYGKITAAAELEYRAACDSTDHFSVVVSADAALHAAEKTARVVWHEAVDALEAAFQHAIGYGASESGLVAVRVAYETALARANAEFEMEVLPARIAHIETVVPSYIAHNSASDRARVTRNAALASAHTSYQKTVTAAALKSVCIVEGGG